MEARDGDHLMIPFECDLCIFHKLRKEEPQLTKAQDDLLLQCIRRANLDAFWSRARTTVNQNKNRVKTAINFSELLGMQGPFEHEGPYPPHDHCGYELAYDMLLYSRRKGKHDPNYT